MPEEEKFNINIQKKPENWENYNDEIKNILQSWDNIEYGECNHFINKEKGIKFCVNGMYRISGISSKPKYSEGYADCMSIIAKWITNEKKIETFLTHHKPEYCFNKKYQFLQNISDKLVKIWSRSKYTPDVVLAGGRMYPTVFYRHRKSMNSEYLNNLEITSNLVKEIYWYYPRIVQTGALYNNIFLNATDLYIHSSEKTPKEWQKPFTWENIDEVIKTWEVKE